MRLAFSSPASCLAPWPVTAGAARGIMDLRAIYGKVGGLVAGNLSGRSEILAMLDACRNPSFRLRDCIPWNYDTWNRDFTISERGAPLLERSDAVADGEFNQCGQIIDLEFLHQPGTIRFDRPWRKIQQFPGRCIGLALGNQPEDGAFAGREGVDRLTFDEEPAVREDGSPGSACRWLFPCPPWNTGSIVFVLGMIGGMRGIRCPEQSADTLRLGQKERLASTQRILRLPPVVDVRAHAKPSDDVSRRVAHGHMPAEEPAILPVGTPQPFLDLCRFSDAQDRAPVVRHSCGVVRMNRGRPVPAYRLFQGKARVLQPAIVEEVDRAVGQRAPNDGRDHVDDKPEPILASPQRVLAALRFDRHARHLHRHVDQLDVLRRWQPRLAVVHGESAEYRVIVPENRRGPDCAQAVTHGDVPATLPERVISRVFGIDRFAQKCGGSTGTHVRRDAKKGLNARQVIVRNARGRDKHQAFLGGVSKQHRTAHPFSMPFDQPNQRFQRLRQGRATGYPFEHAPLALEESAMNHTTGCSYRHARFSLSMLLLASSSLPNAFACRAARTFPAWAAIMDPIINSCHCRANDFASRTPAALASFTMSARTCPT